MPKRAYSEARKKHASSMVFSSTISGSNHRSVGISGRLCTVLAEDFFNFREFNQRMPEGSTTGLGVLVSKTETLGGTGLGLGPGV